MYCVLIICPTLVPSVFPVSVCLSHSLSCLLLHQCCIHFFPFRRMITFFFLPSYILCVVREWSAPSTVWTDWNISCDIMVHFLRNVQFAVTMIGPPVSLDVFLNLRRDLQRTNMEHAGYRLPVHVVQPVTKMTVEP